MEWVPVGGEILEVGPGTGAVTARLVQLLRPGDHLTLVELNDDFVQHLNERFASEPDFQAVGRSLETGPLPARGTWRRSVL